MNTATSSATNKASSAPRRKAVRQNGSRTPASMAEAMEAGMRAASRPSTGTRPSTIIISAEAMKMATAVGQVMPGGAAASSAAPAVDQASTMGMRNFTDST